MAHKGNSICSEYKVRAGVNRLVFLLAFPTIEVRSKLCFTAEFVVSRCAFCELGRDLGFSVPSII